MGFEPQLSTRALLEMRRGLREDDPRLTQHFTTVPATMGLASNLPMEGGCPLAYGLWLGDGLKTICEVEQRWCDLVKEADRRLGNDGSYDCFMTWVDHMPRAEMCRLLLEEVELSLTGRLPAYLRRILLLPGLESAVTVPSAE